VGPAGFSVFGQAGAKRVYAATLFCSDSLFRGVFASLADAGKSQNAIDRVACLAKFSETFGVLPQWPQLVYGQTPNHPIR
jgi:hypothetical protein